MLDDETEIGAGSASVLLYPDIFDFNLENLPLNLFGSKRTEVLQMNHYDGLY